MGIHGLWQLINSSGRPVTLESLENKILAIDVSIWLHQAVRGCKSQYTGCAHNAHLLTLFNRICKLLFYRIKPVFVFDGGVPLLKKQTIAARRQRKELASTESDRTLKKLMGNLLQRHAIEEKLKNSQEDNVKLIKESDRKTDVFELPSLPINDTNNDTLELSQSSDESDQEMFGAREHLQDLDSVDVHSEEFRNLPFDIQHEILTELKEKHKRISRNHINEMPKDSNNFSSFQMTRLLKRRNLQERLEIVEKELNAAASDQTSFGLDYEDSIKIAMTSRRIMSEDCAHYVLAKNLKPTQVNSSQKLNVMKQNETASTSENKVCPGVDTKQIKCQSSSTITDNKSCSDLKSEKVGLVKDEIDKHSNTLEFYQKTVQNYFKNNVYKSESMEKSINEEVLNYSVEKQTNKNFLPEISFESNANLSSEESSDDGECVEKSNKAKNKSEFKNEVKTAEVVNLDLPFIDFSAIEVASSSTSTKLENNNPYKISDDDSSDHSDFLDVDEFIVDKQTEKVGLTLPEPVSMMDKIISSDENSVIGKIQTKENILDVIEIEDTTQKTTEATSVSIAHEESSEEEITEPINLPSTIEEIKEMKQNLISEEKLLRTEKAKFDSVAATITDQMYSESQELLRLFGIPYIVSPMEAEAQCAFLDIKELTHGTITDDSDVWLFGGQRVYKNFFNQTKFVEFFNAKDIKNNFDLDRDKLICLALLSGSDYTDGIEGVGCVTAMEILSEFPDDGIECLRNFKRWYDCAKKQTKIPQETPIKMKLRKFSVPEGFPSDVVVNAYMKPVVDESTERFSWSKPDLASLRDFTNLKFGWTREKADGFLLPVIKNLNIKESQTRIDSYFKVSLSKAPNTKTSKRLSRAIKRMSNKSESQQEINQPGRTRKTRCKDELQTCAPKRGKAKLREKRKLTRVTSKKKVELSEESSDENN